jgi:GNAT superfamily N-acetyltransferase
VSLEADQDCHAPTRIVRRAGPDYATEAIAILREAIAWAKSRGIYVWNSAELHERDFVVAAQAGELVMGFSGHRAAATMLLQSSDNVYWPEAPRGSSLYLHKIAVRRAFAGHGWPGQLIDFAANDAREQGVHRLRLDTLPGPRLTALYARHGFVALDEPPMMVEGRLMIRMERAL